MPIKSDYAFSLVVPKVILKYLEYAINNQCNNILILEDDIDISKYKSEYIFEKLVRND